MEQMAWRRNNLRRHAFVVLRGGLLIVLAHSAARGTVGRSNMKAVRGNRLADERFARRIRLAYHAQ